MFIDELKLYAAAGLSDEDQKIYERLSAFVQSTPDFLKREHIPGHVTGSALVTNLQMDKVLLTLHKKLGKWLQLGGHAEGETSVAKVALREAQEESGLEGLKFLMVLPNARILPFDLDVHEIGARPGEAAHLHFDVRYLLVADSDDSLGISEESADLRWFSLDEAYEACPERSMRRQFEKLEILRQVIDERNERLTIPGQD